MYIGGVLLVAASASTSPPVRWAPTEVRAAGDAWTRSVGCWVQRCVVELELCPWASASASGGGMCVVIAHGAEKVVLERVREELALLALTDELERATTLIASPGAFADFGGFLAGAQEVEVAIERLELDGVLQLATFHPAYQFAGADPDDASNWTNRSPLPIFHLLREAEVARALGAGQTDRDDVWQRNVERTRALGCAHMSRLVAGCRPHDLDGAASWHETE
jgi:hypothetical protein